MRAPNRIAANEALPLFAQPLSVPHGKKQKLGVLLQAPRVVAILVAVTAGSALMAFSRRDGAQSAAKATTKTTKTTTVIEAAQQKDDNTERRPLSFYTETVRGNLFSAPVPPAPRPVVTGVHPKPKPVVVAKAPAKVIVPVVPVASINPFADWSYTGTVKMADRTLALVENSKTNEGEYISVGEQFLGAQVQGITDQQLTLMSGGKPTLLAKSDNVSVKQLGASAPPAPGGPSPGSPGGPSPFPPGGPSPFRPGGPPAGMNNQGPGNNQPMGMVPNVQYLPVQAVARPLK